MSTLTDVDKKELLSLARQSITHAVQGRSLPDVNLKDVSAGLREPGAAFVTLTKRGDLRGCIGSLEACQPLVLDVIEHAADAAINDYRFTPVRANELTDIEVEISVLTAPRKIEYTDAEDLRQLIRPGKDGVVIRDGIRRATFLPQVWQQLPQMDDFMGHLCRKMGASADYWKKHHLDISLYQVIEFKDEEK